MANRNEKVPGSAPGQFYVDQTCIDCDMCRGIAPETFGRNDELGASYVHTQPVTEEQKALALEAMNHCPTGTIGNDGEDY